MAQLGVPIEEAPAGAMEARFERDAPSCAEHRSQLAPGLLRAPDALDHDARPWRPR